MNEKKESIKTFPHLLELPYVEYDSLDPYVDAVIDWKDNFEAMIKDWLQNLEPWPGKECCKRNLRDSLNEILGE